MDVEKNPVKRAEVLSVESLSSDDEENKPVISKSKGFFKDIIYGFKRADLDGIDTKNMTQEEIQQHLIAKAPLKRSLNSFQVSLIAIGGSIGSGLFVGVGNSLASGGIGAVVIGFSIMGLMMFCTMQSIGCVATAYPVNGSYVYFIGRFLNRSTGCALSWIYLENWLVSVPLELIGGALTISYWDSDNNGATRVNKAAWISLFYFVIYVINLFGAAGYGWGEAALSITKVITVIGFCLFGIIVACGGYSGQYAANHLKVQPYYLYGLTGKYIGAHFWYNPGSFVSGVKSVISVMVNASFSYGGTELATLAAAETKNPGKILPHAIKQVFWRILLFYIVSLTIVGCLVPHTDNRLGTTKDGRASPFVIAISNANVRALPSIVNAVICLTTLSVGNAGVFAASRTAASMAAQGFAPQFFGYIDRKGRPLVGIGISALFALLGFLAAYKDYGTVFNWLMAISGLSSQFVWGAMNLATVRLYMAMRAQGRSLDELSFKPLGGVITPIIGMLLNIAVISLQFWTALYPVGGKPSAEGFFESYLSVPIVFTAYFVSKLWLKEKSWYIRASEIDLDTGLRGDREMLVQQNREEAERIRSRGFLCRFYNFWC